jgi:transcriptional regulator with XRE-family HTH domain
MKKTPNPVDRHVGARVRLRRIALGLSQEKLGEALGVTFQQVQKYEKGLNRIGAGRLQLASKVLGAPVSYFFEGAPASAGDGFAEASTPAYDFAPPGSDEAALLSAFAKVTDVKLRRRIVELVEAMVAGGES